MTTIPTATSPLPYLSPATLRGAWAALTTGAIRPVEIELDGPAVGAPVDVVHVTVRDLLFIHEQEARRFGTADECPICAEDA